MPVLVARNRTVKYAFADRSFASFIKEMDLLFCRVLGFACILHSLFIDVWLGGSAMRLILSSIGVHLGALLPPKQSHICMHAPACALTMQPLVHH